jgi:hypothetical protein
VHLPKIPALRVPERVLQPLWPFDLPRTYCSHQSQIGRWLVTIAISRVIIAISTSEHRHFQVWPTPNRLWSTVSWIPRTIQVGHYILVVVVCSGQLCLHHVLLVSFCLRMICQLDAAEMWSPIIEIWLNNSVQPSGGWLVVSVNWASALLRQRGQFSSFWVECSCPLLRWSRGLPSGPALSWSGVNSKSSQHRPPRYLSI